MAKKQGVNNWELLYERKNVDPLTFHEVEVEAYRLITKSAGVKKECLFTYCKDKSNFYYHQGFDPYEVGRYYYRRYFYSPQQIRKYYREGSAFLRTTRKKTSQWVEHIQASLEEKPRILGQAIRDFYRDFVYVTRVFSIMPWWALEAWQHDFEELVFALISKRNLEKQRDLILASMLHPWKDTALRALQKKAHQGVLIKTLVQEYQYLRGWSIIWHQPIVASWIRDVVGDQKELPNRTYSQSQLIKLLKPDRATQTFIRMAPYISFFKDWRDDVRREHAFCWSKVFQMIAQVLGIPYDDLGYLTTHELRANLRNPGKMKQLIQQRKGAPFIMTRGEKPGVLKIIHGPIPERYKRIVEVKKSKDVLKEVVGIIAQSGKVEGMVKIIKTHHDLALVESSHILVANTTHPDYVPAMKKALAFVTDEGGMISHAAIVAREFGKPCIVGTKNATKIFQDGDRVIVDADRGIMKMVQ